MSTGEAGWLRRASAGIWDFVVGDDWILAAGVLVLLLLAGLVGRSFGSWWLLMLGVPALLALSLRRATSKGR